MHVLSYPNKMYNINNTLIKGAQIWLRKKVISLMNKGHVHLHLNSWMSNTYMTDNLYAQWHSNGETLSLRVSPKARANIQLYGISTKPQLFVRCVTYNVYDRNVFTKTLRVNIID